MICEINLWLLKIRSFVYNRYQHSGHIPQFIGINARATYLSLLVLLLKPHTSVLFINARTTYLSLLVSRIGQHTSVYWY